LTQHLIYVIGIGLSLILIIAIFGRAKKSRLIKISMLLIGDIGLVVSEMYYSDQKGSNLIILLILYIILNVMSLRNILSKANSKQEEFNRWHDNSENWKAGIFYYNKADNRIFVPKRLESLGWTINFANPLSVITFVVLIIVLLILTNIFQQIQI
jgi:uncharacterized membrane protein